MFNNVDEKKLEAVAVDSKKLASNLPEVLDDCYGIEGGDVTSLLQTYFPLVNWLLDTSQSRALRSELNGRYRDALSNRFHKETIGEEGEEQVKWVMETPRSIWTELPESTANECCWLPMDFAKCAGKVPINLLCLKDCGDITDDLMGDILRFNQRNAVEPIANPGETFNEARVRLDRLSMLFYTAHNVIQGIDDTYTDTLKPFHGLLAILENPAVMHYDGSNMLAAFAAVGCRLDILGGRNQIIAVNPVIYSAIAAAIIPDANGLLPAGWTKDANGVIRFHGREFIQDKLVPVDITNGTGEAWILDGESLGLFLATDLAPTDSFIRYSGLNTQDAPRCGEECMYMYNLGAAFSNNANRLAVITDIPVQSACAGTIANLAGYVNPQTLIPR